MERSARHVLDGVPYTQDIKSVLNASFVISLEPLIQYPSIGSPFTSEVRSSIALRPNYLELLHRKPFPFILVIFLNMLGLSRFALIALATVGTNAASSVLDLIPSNFDDVVLKSNKPALVEFFAPWCGHCKKLAPVYEELAKNLDFAKDKVSIAKVDADAEKELGRRFGVQGFPTLKWFDGKSDKPEDYNGGRDVESLTDFIVEKTGIKIKKKAAPPSAVEMLTDSTFKTEVGGEKDVLVAFTAPWCGRKFLPLPFSLIHRLGLLYKYTINSLSRTTY